VDEEGDQLPCDRREELPPAGIEVTPGEDVRRGGYGAPQPRSPGVGPAFSSFGVSDEDDERGA